jgi:hypothetical protein
MANDVIQELGFANGVTNSAFTKMMQNGHGDEDEEEKKAPAGDEKKVPAGDEKKEGGGD